MDRKQRQVFNKKAMIPEYNEGNVSGQKAFSGGTSVAKPARQFCHAMQI